MEMRRYIFGVRSMLYAAWLCALLLGSAAQAFAQLPPNFCGVNEGKMEIVLQKNISTTDLNDFIAKYDLDDLPLKAWLKGEMLDELKRFGWILNTSNPFSIVLSKPIEGLGDFTHLQNKILFAENRPAVSELYPLGVFRSHYGFNKFKSGNDFEREDSVVYFVLQGYRQAREVKLAGSFTHWQYNALPMTKTATGWMYKLPLKPGKHYYKFIVDGHWITHPDNELKENDGKGNMNSVYYQPNHVFKLRDGGKANRVYVSGSFNDWRRRDAALHRVNGGWELPVYLPEGTHTYRFVVDNNWTEDKSNADKFPNEYGEYNSVVRIGKPYLFRLEGYQQATQVKIAGSFNGWKEHELFLQKKAGGWELNYHLGPGNYAYKYMVDGQRVEGNGQFNSGTGAAHFVIQPNYTFRLKGYLSAKTVYLSGSFNQWSEKGFPMKQQNGEWVLPMHLPAGKNAYKFIVDGEWMIDPANKHWEVHEVGGKNSIFWFEGL